MKEFVPVLKRTKLFSGVGDDDISTMLSCLEARLLTYMKENLHPVTRILFIVAALLMIVPEYISTIVGIGLLVVAFVLQKVLQKKIAV